MSSRFFFVVLHAKIGMELIHVRLQFGVGEAIDHLTVLDDVETIRNRGREAEILFDQQDREAF